MNQNPQIRPTKIKNPKSSIPFLSHVSNRVKIVTEIMINIVMVPTLSTYAFKTLIFSFFGKKSVMMKKIKIGEKIKKCSKLRVRTILVASNKAEITPNDFL